MLSQEAQGRVEEREVGEEAELSGQDYPKWEGVLGSFLETSSVLDLSLMVRQCLSPFSPSPCAPEPGD